MHFKKEKLTVILAGVFCSAALSFTPRALILDTAEKGDLDSDISYAQIQNSSALLGWDFETEISENEIIGDGVSYTYENGMLVFNLKNASKTAEFIPDNVPSGEDINLQNGKYLVVRLKNASDGTKLQFMYQTEDHTGWDTSSRAFTASIASGCDEFITYTFDLSTLSTWGKSAYKTSKLCFPGAVNGRIEIEEVYFTDTRPVGTNEYFSPMSNRFGTSPKADTGFSASRTDNWASIIKTNADGSFTFTGHARLENYSAWITPTHVFDCSKMKYLVMRCSNDIALQEFVMLLVRAENGEFQTWNVNSNHYEIKKSGNDSYIILNLASLGNIQGKISNIQLYARVLAGTVYDAYWSETGKTADKMLDKSAIYFEADEINTPLGRLSLQGVRRYLDGHEDVITFESSDETVAAVVTENGKTYLSAKNNGNVTVYAKIGGEIVAEKEINISGQVDLSPVTLDFSARGDILEGIRIKASILPEVKNLNTSDISVGFIATRQKVLDSFLLDDEELTLTLPENVSFVTADSYICKDTSVRLDNTTETSKGTFIQCLLTDIPHTKEAYTAVFAVRPYVKLDGGAFYGDAKKTSLYDIVKALPESEIEKNEFFKSVIDLCEKAELATTEESENETIIDMLPILDRDALASVESLFTEEIENTRPLKTNLNILGKSVISEDGASVTLSPLFVTKNILDAFIPQNISWNVDSRLVIATANDDGTLTLTGKMNGEVNVLLKADVDGTEYEASLNVTVIGQSDGYTLSFDKNTSENVTNMPEAIPAKGIEEFPLVYPRRDTFRFVGWSLTSGGTPVEHVDVKNNTTVYAVWEKALSFDFNKPNNDEGFKTDGSDVLADGGSLSFTAVSGTELVSPVLDIASSDAKALLINMKSSVYGTGKTLNLTLYTSEDTYVFAKNIASDALTLYDFDLRGIEGNVTGFKLGFDGVDGKISIDDIMFTGKSILLYDANTSAVVKNMPANIRTEEQIGTDGLTVSTVVPTRTGYKFLCWSASPESKLPVTGKIGATAENPVTLYAVWDKNDHYEFDTYVNSFHPQGIQSFSFSGGVFKFTNVNGASIDNIASLGYSTDTTSKKIEMRLRWKVADASGLRATVCVWTDKVAQYPAASEISYDLSKYGTEPEEFVTIVLDGTNFKYLQSNTLSNLRIRPINKDGECEIDYIRFVGSEANILVSGNYKSASQDVSFIVPASATIVPQGVAVWNELHLAGNIDFTSGIAVIKDEFEASHQNGYKTFVLDMDAEKVSSVDTMFVGTEAVPMINGATYVIPADKAVTFEKTENTTGITMTINGDENVFIGDENSVYTAVFDGEIEEAGVIWMVDREDIATVDENGVITVHKEGMVRLTAVSVYDSSINASINITVLKHAFTMSLEGEENIVIDGNTRTYKVNFYGDIPENKAIAFTSDNPEIASVNGETGEVTIHGAGTVKITASAVYNPEITAEITLNIRYAEFELTIEGPDTITKEGRSAEYKCIKSGEHSGKMTFTWSVSDPLKATVTVDGRLTPKDNGEVTIRATSDYNPAIYAEKTVTLTNQTGLYSITYHSGTQDTVTGMPETEYGKKNFTLSDAVPQREGYFFLGWTDSEDSIKTITEINVKNDVDVYALWGKGINYEFNGSLDGVTWIMNGAGTLSDDGYLIVNAYGDTRLFMKSMSIDPHTHREIQVRVSDSSANYVKVFYATETDNPDGTVKKVGYDNNGFADAERLSMAKYHNANGLGNWVNVTFPMYTAYDYVNLPTDNMWFYGAADRITGLWINVGGVRAGTVYVDYIRIPNISREITFDAATDDEVSGMPENISTTFGKAFNIDKLPTREGYICLGFAKTPGDAENARKSFAATDDMTLYAVWSKVYTPSGDENRIDIGTPNSRDGDSILVKASSKTEVTLYLDGQPLTAVTNGSGYAVFDISDETEAKDVYVTADDKKLYEALVLPKSVSEKYIIPQTESESSKKIDMTVTDIVSNTPSYNTKEETAEQEFIPVPDYNGITEEILINFEESIEKRLFRDYRYVSEEGMADSSLKIHVKTDSDASIETVDLNLDAASHPYVVMKIRNKEANSMDIGFNFLSDVTGTRYITSNSTTLAMDGDWTMLVYDMSENAKWNGNINNLRFTFEKAVDDTFFIDWILFTDTVPESMEYISGAKTYFETVNQGELPFDDVNESDWYYSKVRTMWKIGFINGVSENTFDPEGTVTAAQAITLAVRIKNRLMSKEAILTSGEGEAWFEPYVREAIKYRIITEGQFTDYNAPISRKTCVDILYHSLPPKFFKSINYFGKVPDMDENDPEHASVLKMYDAGIIIGRDDKHEFFPDSFITRAELSTVITRMISDDDRERIITDAERELNKITFTGKDILDKNCYFYDCNPVKPVLDGTVAITKSLVGDPIVYLSDLYKFDKESAAMYSKIRIGMKWDTSVVPNPAGRGMCIYFTTENETAFAEDRRIGASWNGTTDENGIGEFVIDLKSNAKSADIRSFRFDPFDVANCEFGIAYIIIEQHHTNN